MANELPLDASGSGVWTIAGSQRAFVSRRFVRGPFERMLGIAPLTGTPAPPAGTLVVSTALREALTDGRSAPVAVRFDGLARAWPVSGEVADLRFTGRNTEREAAVYLPLEAVVTFDLPMPTMQLLVACQAACPADAIAGVVRAIGPYAEPRAPVTTLGALYERANRPARAWALAANTYAALTLLIVMLGVYTLSGAVVVRSAFEAGMRLVVGASRTDVVARLVARVCTPASIGIATGVAVTMAAMRQLAVLDASAPIGRTLAAAAAVLFVTCGIAALLPALALVRRPLVSLLRRE